MDPLKQEILNQIDNMRMTVKMKQIDIAIFQSEAALLSNQADKLENILERMEKNAKIAEAMKQ